jgi:hypothetical protein
MRRNLFVKKWILEVLRDSEKPLSANAIVVRIKEMRRKESPCEPRISSVKVCKVAVGMPEVKRVRDHKRDGFLYSIK